MLGARARWYAWGKYLLLALTFASFLSYLATGEFAYIGLCSSLILLLLVLRVVHKQGLATYALRQGFGAMRRGDYAFRLYSEDLEEEFPLTQAFNEALGSVERSHAELSRKLTEQDAVLSSMAEGVVAIDGDERVLRINDTASSLLGVNQFEVLGRSVQEVIRNADVLKFISRAHLSREPVEAEITWHTPHEKILRVYGRALRDAQWNTIGVLVVFSDITRLRQLENVRRDFVANVSHELRTPITSIKGFIETLLDGAIDKPADARRFLEIMNRQVDRLNAIFDDLLSLSRIEEGNRRGEMRLEEGNVISVVKAAIESCASRAGQKSIAIVERFPSQVMASLNANLLEQAIVNLLDNAIKYSDERTTIIIAVAEVDGEVRIDVIDQGPGIERGHLPRLFERFYRVDKARTRKAGGTGLGLAIVKHIAECHHGRATVESTPGKGSTFSLHIGGPQREGEERVH